MYCVLYVVFESHLLESLLESFLRESEQREKD